MVLYSYLLVFLIIFSSDVDKTEYSVSNAISLTHPIQSEVQILSGFGKRVHPVLQTERKHTGIDYRVEFGDPVFSAAAGEVLKISYDNSYGHYLEIAHDNGFVTRYAQLSEISDDMKVGISVDESQQVALAGNSGQTTGTILHFELLLDGQAIDPILFFEN